MVTIKYRAEADEISMERTRIYSGSKFAIKH